MQHLRGDFLLFINYFEIITVSACFLQTVQLSHLFKNLFFCHNMALRFRFLILPALFFHGKIGLKFRQKKRRRKHSLKPESAQDPNKSIERKRLKICKGEDHGKNVKKQDHRRFPWLFPEKIESIPDQMRQRVLKSRHYRDQVQV